VKPDGFRRRFAKPLVYGQSMPPKPELTRDDFENPDAPEDERRLRPDHPAVRDLSYERSRGRQVLDLYKQSLFDPGWEPRDADDHSPWPRDRLEVYMKERPRGAGYVADFLYLNRDLPVTVYGVFVNRGRGLEVAELELFRASWGHYDMWGDFVGAQGLTEDEEGDDQDCSKDNALITSDLLRRIPLGSIIAKAQRVLAQDDWREEGIRVLMGPDKSPDDMTAGETQALETALQAATDTRRGRPPVPDDLLQNVAHAYLEEAARGPGLTRRLALRFDRPEATVRDWIMAARRRGFLSAAAPGRRGAVPGPRLTRPVTTDTAAAAAQQHSSTAAQGSGHGA